MPRTSPLRKLCDTVRHLPGEPQGASSGDSSGLLTSARIR